LVGASRFETRRLKSGAVGLGPPLPSSTAPARHNGEKIMSVLLKPVVLEWHEVSKWPDRDPWFDLQIYYHNPDAYESLSVLLKTLDRQLSAEGKRDLKRFVRLARERFGSTLGLTHLDPNAASINDWLEERWPGVDPRKETVTLRKVVAELEKAAQPNGGDAL